MGRIWTRLEKGEIQSIEVWGMGGVGKTIIVTHYWKIRIPLAMFIGLLYQKNQALVGWKMILLKR